MPPFKQYDILQVENIPGTYFMNFI